MGEIQKTAMPYQLRVTIFGGLIIRLVVLFVILVICQNIVEPYFISDDVKIDDNVSQYISSAKGIIDFRVFNSLSLNHAYPFWSFVNCVLGKMFNTPYVSRYLNVVLSTVSIYLVYQLTLEITRGTEKTAIRAARLMAFLPYPVFVCCFGIKDIFITVSVLCIYNLLLKILHGKKIRAGYVVLTVLLAIGTRFIRGAVIEFLLLSFLVFLFSYLCKHKKYFWLLFSIVASVIALYLLKDMIMDAFLTKIEDYSDSMSGSSFISIYKIKKITHIYKLPLAILFATLQPMLTNYFDLSAAGDRIWLQIISLLNISIYPIAIGNFVYIFQKKKEPLFWLSTMIMYSAVLILSLGVFRHYLFLFPIILISYSLYTEKRDTSRLGFLVEIIGTASLGTMVFVFSILR